MASGTESTSQIDNSCKCRICMFPKPTLSSLFRRGLSMKVMKLADIKMYEGDGLPSTICLDCEMEVNRCVNFICQIQRADAKLRELLELDLKEAEYSEKIYEKDKAPEETDQEIEQEASTTQIDIEEFNVKQEMSILDNYLDEKTDLPSDSDHDHFEDDMVNKYDQPEDELNPLNHVDVVENINRSDGMDVSDDPLGQEEPLIESQKTEYDPSGDPLTCMKQEPVPMDIDKSIPEPEPCGSSSSVNETYNQTGEILGINQGHHFLSMIRKNLFALCQTSSELTSGQISNTANSTAYSVNDEGNSHNFVRYIRQESDKKLSKAKNTKIVSIKKEIKHITHKNRQDSININKVLTNQNVEPNTSFCFFCYVECGSEELLQEHKMGSGFICRICTEECENHQLLEDHCVRNHKIYKCRMCVAVFISKKDYLQHKKSHQFEKLECEMCNKMFSNRKSLGHHKNNIHNKNGNKFCCDICGKTFPLHRLWIHHMRKMHTAYEYIECKFCQTLFLGPERLKVHIKAHHIDSDDSKCASCNVCGKIFKNSSLLKYHQEVHDNTVITCTICGQSVEGKRKLKLHMGNEHSEIGIFTCKTCNEQFVTKLKLKRHFQKKHKIRPTSMPVFCEICGKQYKTMAVLKKHRNIHFDERPFKCDLCDASFKIEVCLKNHSRVHSSTFKYKCDACGMGFKWKQTWDNHLKKCSAIYDNVDDLS